MERYWTDRHGFAIYWLWRINKGGMLVRKQFSSCRIWINCWLIWSRIWVTMTYIDIMCWLRHSLRVSEMFYAHTTTRLWIHTHMLSTFCVVGDTWRVRKSFVRKWYVNSSCMDSLMRSCRNTFGWSWEGSWLINCRYWSRGCLYSGVHWWIGSRLWSLRQYHTNKDLIALSWKMGYEMQLVACWDRTQNTPPPPPWEVDHIGIGPRPKTKCTTAILATRFGVTDRPRRQSWCGTSSYPIGWKLKWVRDRILVIYPLMQASPYLIGLSLINRNYMIQTTTILTRQPLSLHHHLQWIHLWQSVL